jgi:hypothetical protein
MKRLVLILAAAGLGGCVGYVPYNAGYGYGYGDGPYYGPYYGPSYGYYGYYGYGGPDVVVAPRFGFHAHRGFHRGGDGHFHGRVGGDHEHEHAGR